MAKSKLMEGMNRRKVATTTKKTTATATDSKPKSKQPPHRANKAPLIAYVNKAFLKQLKLHCIEEETNQQQVIIDALNEYFENRNKAGIA